MGIFLNLDKEKAVIDTIINTMEKTKTIEVRYCWNLKEPTKKTLYDINYKEFKQLLVDYNNAHYKTKDASVAHRADDQSFQCLIEAANRNNNIITFVSNAGYVVAEVIVGVLTGCIAIEMGSKFSYSAAGTIARSIGFLVGYSVMADSIGDPILDEFKMDVSDCLAGVDAIIQEN